MPDRSFTAITVDSDWAPDWVMEEVITVLVAHRVKATWFITHESPVLKTLRNYSDLFEIGIHPNFFSDSTHGGDERDVFRYMKRIVPEAKTMRTHGLYQSTHLLMLASREFNIKVDCSLLLPGQPCLRRHVLALDGVSIARIPSFWEDDVEMGYTFPRFSVNKSIDAEPGLKIYNFHPIHIELNSYDMEPYHKLRKDYDIKTIMPEDFHGYMNPNRPGTKTLFMELVEMLSSGGHTISEIERETA